jgi:pyruvate dehydrogenase (quinone)
VLEFISDPDVPPLPPHISFQQARAYMTALTKNDPDELGIIKQSVRQVLAGILPHGDKDDSDKAGS